MILEGNADDSDFVAGAPFPTRVTAPGEYREGFGGVKPRPSRGVREA